MTVRRIALGVEYCGTSFHGWQSQTNGGTVQDAVESALREIAGQAVGVICAGRTDAGVHASHQVIHFDAPIDRPLTAWVRGVNSHLPDGDAVRWDAEVRILFGEGNRFVAGRFVHHQTGALVKMPSRCARMTAVLMEDERPKSSALTIRRLSGSAIICSDISRGGPQPGAEDQQNLLRFVQSGRARAEDVEFFAFQFLEQPPVNRAH